MDLEKLTSRCVVGSLRYFCRVRLKLIIGLVVWVSRSPNSVCFVGKLQSVVVSCDKVLKHCSAVMSWSCPHDRVIHWARVGERGDAEAVYFSQSAALSSRAKKTRLISKFSVCGFEAGTSSDCRVTYKTCWKHSRVPSTGN